MKRLILAPHADDESLGCGGLIAKYPEECTVLVVAQPSRTRQEEFDAAMSVFAIWPHPMLSYPDGRVDADKAALVRDLDGIMAYIQPDEVYLPYPGLHQDHVAVYEAGMRACRLSMTEGHWYPPSVLVYDVAVYDIDLYPTGLTWNVFETLTSEQVDLKQKACSAYASEHPGSPHHPASSIRELAAAVGRPRGVAYAERYALVRSRR